MTILLLAVHIMIAVALVGVVLLQKSEGGALGMGGGGMSGFMTGRSTANLLTRATAILAAAFMMTSVLLVVLNNRRARPSFDHRPGRTGAAGASRGPAGADGTLAGKSGERPDPIGSGRTKRADRALIGPVNTRRRRDPSRLGVDAPYLPIGSGGAML